MCKRTNNNHFFVKQIDDLKQNFCPERFRYTHEFLELASKAALHEARSDGYGDECPEKNDAGTLADLVSVH